MRRLLGILLVAVTALLPLGSALGTMTPAPDAQEMPCHQPAGEQSAKSCPGAEGCCVAFLTAAVAVKAAADVRAERIYSGAHEAVDFVPEHLDPPPLAL